MINQSIVWRLIFCLFLLQPADGNSGSGGGSNGGSGNGGGGNSGGGGSGLGGGSGGRDTNRTP